MPSRLLKRIKPRAGFTAIAASAVLRQVATALNISSGQC